VPLPSPRPLDPKDRPPLPTTEPIELPPLPPE